MTTDIIAAPNARIQNTENHDVSENLIPFFQTQSSTELSEENVKSDSLTCDNANTFSGLIERAINLGSGYRQKSREVSAAHYAAAYKYYADESNREQYEVELKNFCAESEIDVTPGKTSPYHMIVRLTFKDATKQYVSDKVHVLRVALAKQIKPEDFLRWLESESGERKIVETYERDGSSKQKDSLNDGENINTDEPPRERNRNVQIQCARQQLAGAVVFTVDAATVSQTLPALQIDTECAAIIVRQADGGVVVKAIVEDHDIAEDVYAGYYRANSHEIDSAIQQQKISEMLGNPEEIKLTDIRKALGDEIADKAAKVVLEVNEFNREMANIPQELQKYVELLKKGDLVANTSGAKSYASYFETAMEELDQVLGGDPSLRRYLDRPFDPTITLCPELVPRLINSKSMHIKNSSIVTKQRALRDALRHELESLRGIS